MWTTSEAGLDPFALAVPADYLARNVNQSFDFTRTHLYSDLDVSRVEAGLHASYRFTPRVWLAAGYRYLDYEDDAPYLYDTTGSADLYRLALGWRF